MSQKNLIFVIIFHLCKNKSLIIKIVTSNSTTYFFFGIIFLTLIDVVRFSLTRINLLRSFLPLRAYIDNNIMQFGNINISLVS